MNGQPIQQDGERNMKLEKKQCNRCKKKKKLDKFHKDAKGSHGCKSVCKKCKLKEWKVWRKTEGYFIAKIYADQRACSKRRGHEMPQYTKIEFSQWLLSQPKFHKLHKKWIKTKNKLDAPSVDRDDPNRGYSFSNITLMTWGENKQKGYDEIRNGKHIKKYKPLTPVIKMDLIGNYICEYISMGEAARDVGASVGNISTHIANPIRHKHVKGFLWKKK